MHEPPKADVCSPARLFRVLASAQPRWPVDYRPPGLERFRLEARGLSACEAAHLFDELDRLHTDKRAVIETLDLIALALLADGRQAFASGEEVGALPSYVVNALAMALRDALRVCSPLYRSTDDSAWDRVLREGAAKGANAMVSLALGNCIDEGFSRFTPRPDRFFGVPTIAVTDGQWMAFRAARWFVDSITTKAKPPPMPRRK